MGAEAVALASALTVYFVLHSLAASLWLKQRVTQRWPGSMRYYRLLFNAFAILLGAPLAVFLWSNPGEMLWQWQAPTVYFTNGLAVLALCLFAYSLRLYDLGEFFGTRQWIEARHAVIDQERLCISPLHRYVRHPWYFLLLVLLWTRDLSANHLIAYAMISLYLVIGSALEERKLISYHGALYRRYRARVAGLIPLPWKILSRTEAEALNCEHSQHQDQRPS